MGDTLWLQIHDGQQTSGGERDNSIMLMASEALDALADQLGVAKLSGFYDHSELADAYADELDGIDIPEMEEAWFDAAVGSQVVGAILGALRDGSPPLPLKLDASNRHWREDLVEELEYCHGVLSEAARHGHRFRLVIVS